MKSSVPPDRWGPTGVSDVGYHVKGTGLSQLKIDSARRQLGTALALYLQDLDPVSVHCLAGGGCELIEYYDQKAGGEPFSSHILKTYPDIDIRKVRLLQRKF
jgi:hypothetical protein